jgi:hypothetical protein
MIMTDEAFAAVNGAFEICRDYMLYDEFEAAVALDEMARRLK